MREKDLVKQQFGKNSQSYVTSTTHGNEADVANLVQLLKPMPNGLALDIATGGGHVAKQLAKFVDRVVAADLSEAMLANTAKHLADLPNIDYIIADAEQLPFLTDSFDIVTCRIAAHHFPHPDKFIAEVCRVLKPKGKFLLVDNIASENSTFDTFVNKLEKLRDPSHVRSLSISEWKNHFYQKGLQIMYEQVRKKSLPYNEWIHRMLDKESDMQAVNHFIRNAARM